MSEQNAHKSAACPEDRRHWLGRRARLIVAAITLLGIGAVLGTAVSVHAARTGGWHAAGHHWRSAKSEEQVRERALDGTAWVLGRIDASAEQQTRVNEIVSALVGELYPLRDQHHARRRQLITELARPQVDRAALEQIRADGVAAIELASKTVMDAVIDVTDVLTDEQREELTAMIARHRR